MAIAMPSFTQFVKDARIGGQARGLLSDLQYARSEAAKRNQNVALCASSDGAACTDDWASSRIIFVDANRDGARGNTEEILRISEAPVLPQTLTGPDDGFVFFRSTGQINTATTFTFCDDRAGNFGRLITISAAGRSDVTKVECGEENEGE